MSKLSSKTLQVLKNFVTINQGLTIKPGSKLRTVSTQKNIFAEVDIPDTFDTGFSIYDLSEFLSAYNLLKDPELEFMDSYVLMTSNNNKIKYFYSNASTVVSPADKDITFPEADVSFEFLSEDFSKVLKASAILKCSNFEVNQNGIVVANSNAVGNNFIIEKEMVSSQKEFSYSIPVENLKLISDLNYQVEVSSKGISKFSSAEYGIQYFIAINAK